VFNWERFEKAKNDPDAIVPEPDGSVFIGDKGIITTGTYGEQTRLLPVEKMKEYQFPDPLQTRSPGHYRDWIRACKGGDPSCSNFNIAASVRRVDAAGRGRAPRRGQARVGRRQDAVYQQPGSE